MAIQGGNTSQSSFCRVIVFFVSIGRLNCRSVNTSIIRSPRTDLGLEEQLTGLGLGLETLRPRPHIAQPRGLVYCNVLISYSVENRPNCQFQLNIGNCYCKVSLRENQAWQQRR